MSSTHTIITKLVHLIIETGCLTGKLSLFITLYSSSPGDLRLALAATIDITLFLAFPNNSYHGCVALTLAKLYSNSLLVIFNSRIRIHGGRNSPSTVNTSVISYGTKSNSKRATLTLGGRTAISSFGGVQIQEETITDSIPLEEQVSNSEQITCFIAYLCHYLTDALSVQSCEVLQSLC